MTNPSPEWLWGIAIILFGLALMYGVTRGKRPWNKARESDDHLAGHQDLLRVKHHLVEVIRPTYCQWRGYCKTPEFHSL
jgi:hypothetical protein